MAMRRAWFAVRLTTDTPNELQSKLLYWPSIDIIRGLASRVPSALERDPEGGVKPSLYPHLWIGL